MQQARALLWHRAAIKVSKETVFENLIDAIEKETFLFVTLRCANIHADKITRYAGAGITADSDAEKEFEETELKMNVIGAVFSKLTI